MAFHNLAMTHPSFASWVLLKLACGLEDPAENRVWYRNSMFGDPGREALSLGRPLENRSVDHGLGYAAADVAHSSPSDSIAQSEEFADESELLRQLYALTTLDASVEEQHDYDSYNAQAFEQSTDDWLSALYSELFQSHSTGSASGFLTEAPYLSPSALGGAVVSETTQDQSIAPPWGIPEIREAAMTTPTSSASKCFEPEPPRRFNPRINKRRPRGRTQTTRVSSTKQIGVTMRLRTLARKLLAGSGWIMHSSISKRDAKQLIVKLLGNDLTDALHIPTSSAASRGIVSTSYEHYIANLLPSIMTYHTGKRVTCEDSEMYIIRDKGPYHLTEEFLMLLEGRIWPPFLPSEAVLRAFNCYRED